MPGGRLPDVVNGGCHVGDHEVRNKAAGGATMPSWSAGHRSTSGAGRPRATGFRAGRPRARAVRGGQRLVRNCRPCRNVADDQVASRGASSALARVNRHVAGAGAERRPDLCTVLVGALPDAFSFGGNLARSPVADDSAGILPVWRFCSVADLPPCRAVVAVAGEDARWLSSLITNNAEGIGGSGPLRGDRQMHCSFTGRGQHVTRSVASGDACQMIELKARPPRGKVNIYREGFVTSGGAVVFELPEGPDADILPAARPPDKSPRHDVQNLASKASMRLS